MREDFRFHIPRTPPWKWSKNTLCDTVWIWHFATLFPFPSGCPCHPSILLLPPWTHRAPLFGNAHSICWYNVKCRWKNVRNLIKLRYLKSVCLATWKGPVPGSPCHFPPHSTPRSCQFPAPVSAPVPPWSTSAAVKWALPISACVTQKAATPTGSQQLNSFSRFSERSPRISPPPPPAFLSAAANLPRFCCPMRQKWQFLIKLFSFSFRIFYFFLPQQQSVVEGTGVGSAAAGGPTSRLGFSLAVERQSSCLPSFLILIWGCSNFYEIALWIFSILFLSSSLWRFFFFEFFRFLFNVL